MALIKRPAKSHRILVKIDQIKRKQGTGANATQVPIVVKMKRSHARLFGQQQMLSSDPMFLGTFPGTAGTGNGGAKYIKKLGGYKGASYKFHAETTWTITEQTTKPDGTEENTQVQLKTISVGFPKGVSLNEILTWVAAKDSSFRNNLLGITTPTGSFFPYVDSSETAPTQGA